VTGQVEIDRYVTTGIEVARDLANTLVVDPGATPEADLRRLFAFDPDSAADLEEGHTPALTRLAGELHTIFAALDRADLDTAAGGINVLLERSPAHPHLAKQDGAWTLHHHPADTELVTSWTAICGEALARLVGAGYGERAHLCEATDCRRVYIDTTKNGTRRFCSATCQNRVKAAALRRRRAEA
jgi:predicted RNA-binding Zn ribbon-like protein